MSTNSAQLGIETGAVPARERVSISRWVNEPYPPWDQILTTHDVARLVRRSGWMLNSLAAVGRFPRKHRFRGKKIGWLKADILEWMMRTPRSKGAPTSENVKPSHHHRLDRLGEQALPLEYESSHPSQDLSSGSHFAGVSP